MENEKIHIGRLSQCTFEQALELSQRGWEGYRQEMSRYFPLMAPEPPAEPATDGTQEVKKPEASALDRLLNRFGPNGIRAEHSVVAFVNDQPVGYVFIAMKVVNGKKLAWNGGTGVFPEYRGLGLAKLMMIEVYEVLNEQEVDQAYLEVVTQNSRALSAYKKGGFQIVDQMIGLRCREPLTNSIYSGDLPQHLRLQYGMPKDVAELSFYREDAAWGSMWHNLNENGESLIVRDVTGSIIGYALFKRSGGSVEDGFKTITLFQCEVDGDMKDKETIFRIILSEVFNASTESCNLTTSNLSMSNPIVVELLKEAGFATVYEQYLMKIVFER